MREFKNVKNILVVKLRHIGDALLTVPVFRALRENFHDAHIAVLVNSGTEEVLTGNPLINEMIVFDRNMKGEKIIGRFERELAFLLMLRKKHFDMAIDLTSGDRAAVISFASGARYRIAYDPLGQGFAGKRYIYTHLGEKNERQHMVLQNLDLIKQFGISTANLAVDFYIPDEAKSFVKSIFEANGIKDDDKVVHVHPTSRWTFKCWKDEYMAEVIQWLLEKGVKVIVTSAPDARELDRTKKILSLVGDSPDSTAPPVNQGLSPLDLCGKTTIKQLAAISQASDLFLGVDSAPMHIAAAAGTPVVALFAMTDEVQWGPWNGDKHYVIREKMECMPCPKGGCEGLPLRKCMEAIKPDAVKNIIKACLAL
ncbi:MAG: putative lipopolysaccharide heptosyltransferase III [Thermodesulfovibrionales bacterium]|nr:putative lipopolysaccharide heptosyltransferase III [Thermodesulfovibrionales bacterium]